jgi:hypothetical protein
MWFVNRCPFVCFRHTQMCISLKTIVSNLFSLSLSIEISLSLSFYRSKVKLFVVICCGCVGRCESFFHTDDFFLLHICEECPFSVRPMYVRETRMLAVEPKIPSFDNKHRPTNQKRTKHPSQNNNFREKIRESEKVR